MYSEERVYLSVHLLFPQVLPSPSTSPSVTDFTIRNSFRSTALYKYRMTKATDDDSNNNAENFYDDDNKMATMTRQRQQCSPVHAPRTRIDQRWIVSSTSARLPTCGIAAQWVEWLWNQRGHSLVLSLVRSHRSPICLLRTFRFTRTLHCAHSFAHTLALELKGERFMSISYHFNPECAAPKMIWRVVDLRSPSSGSQMSARLHRALRNCIESKQSRSAQCLRVQNLGVKYSERNVTILGCEFVYKQLTLRDMTLYKYSSAPSGNKKSEIK